MANESYNPKELEAKWQAVWQQQKLFAADDDSGLKKMYVLDMFPYPSGDGLHVGHVKIYTASDIVARYLRMKGFNVLHPMGWDAFGLPTENSAIKFGIHPAELTRRNTDRFREQMQSLGFSYDWDREINTTDPAYVKWTQWIWLQLFRMGLAYEDTIPINWCPQDKTGLSNEEVIDGKCERCGTPVIQKPMRQWLLKITKYADRLLEGLGGLDWPEHIIELQRNWIGRSEGAEVVFTIDQVSGVAPTVAGSKKLEVRVFTTRADTLYGATYLVLAPEHDLLDLVTAAEQKAVVEEYVQQAHQKTDLERTDLIKEKTGVFTGGYAINPMNKEKVPIWVADYVLGRYGTGAIMAVPAHDERDHAFAKQYGLPIKQVIVPAKARPEVELPYLADGVLKDSGRHDGLTSEEARRRIMSDLQLHGQGKPAVSYKLRDWVFSRQRYWGEPIPIIHCDKCGTVPVPEQDLPVTLPELDTFEPTGTGESPLAAVEDWVVVKCPTCAGMGRRETNTMPQWAGSSWYFLRYLDPHNEEALADPAKLNKWMPVDVYMGGAEHAVLHLLYARFWHKVLHDAGVVSTEEPFTRLRDVGLVLGEDGQKMSKSRGNVINPDDEIAKFGADTTRMFAMFMGPFNASAAWSATGIGGVNRFLKRVWIQMARLIDEAQSVQQASHEESTEDIDLAVQRAIKRVSESIEQFKFNTGVSALMELLNVLEEKPHVHSDVLETLVLLLSPYAPHLAEELWEKLGHSESVSVAGWPVYDEQVLKGAEITIPVQVNGRVRGTLVAKPGVTQDYLEAQARALPNVAKYLEQATVSKVVFVPDRLINFVTAASNE